MDVDHGVDAAMDRSSGLIKDASSKSQTSSSAGAARPSAAGSGTAKAKEKEMMFTLSSLNEAELNGIHEFARRSLNCSDNNHPPDLAAVTASGNANGNGTNRVSLTNQADAAGSTAAEDQRHDNAPKKKGEKAEQQCKQEMLLLSEEDLNSIHDYARRTSITGIHDHHHDHHHHGNLAASSGRQMHVPKGGGEMVRRQYKQVPVPSVAAPRTTSPDGLVDVAAAVTETMLPQPLPLRGDNILRESCPGAYAFSPFPGTTTATAAGARTTTTTTERLPTSPTVTQTQARTAAAGHNDDHQDLAVANLVADEGDPECHPKCRDDLMHANPINLEMQRKRQQEHKKQKKTMIFILVLVAIAGAAIIGTVAATTTATQKNKETTEESTNDSNTQSAPAPALSLSELSAVPSTAPSGVLDELLFRLPDNTRSALQQYGTPQWKAWDWLTNHQNITNMPEWRKQQLFAMATFFYSFEGEHWWKPVQDRWMDDTLDECLWYSGGFGHFDPGADEIPKTGDDKFIEFPDGFPFKLEPCNNLGQLTRLDVSSLGLGSAELDPTVPQEILLLTSLDELFLGYSEFEANLLDLLPAELPPTLRYLSLVDTLKGSLPTEVGVLFQNVTWLLLAQNSLTGTLPTEFGLLTALGSEVNLNSNYISGTIPTELARLSNVVSWWMPSNNFVGRIPSEFGLLTSSQALNVENALLTGWIPSELSALTNLQHFMLGNSLLSGLVPTELGLMEALSALHLQGNSHLGGRVPSELGLLSSSLEMLDLSNLPQLTGTLPWELDLLTNLVWLDLQGSHGLSGTIPEGLCFLQNESCVFGDWNQTCSFTFDCTGKVCGCDCPFPGMPVIR